MTGYEAERDPILNVIYGQIVRSIDVLNEAGCWLDAAKLVYSGIDTMAYLGLPKDKEDVTRADFILWCARYVQFPCKEQLSGEDLYGARCAVLHQHGIHSRLSREGKCRLVGYMDQSVPEVLSRREDPDSVLVSVAGLIAAFKQGVNRYLPELFADSARGEVATSRLTWMHHKLPVKPPPEG